ncbi:MAG: hypothetical protein PSV18_01810 [Methylobacter sp.]|nr:hypothetical protein [Candidatus Methylobacter titanis]
MINKSAASLDQFRYRPNESDIFITCCHSGIFSIHPSLKRVVEDVFVVFHANRYHLVDGDLYHRHIRVEGMLRANLFEGVDIEGKRFLLVSTFPLSGVNTDWSESVADVVCKARENWVRMTKLKKGGGYTASLMSGIRDNPIWTKQPMAEFVMEAFGENLITVDNLPAGLSGDKQSSRSGRTSHRVIDEDFDE